MGWIPGLKYLSGWGRLPLYGRFGYVGMTRFLMIKILLLCRSSIGVRLCSVHGRRSSVWRTATSLRRSLHGWRIRRRSLLPNMGGSIILGSALHHLCSVAFSFCLDVCDTCFRFSWSVVGCVHLSYAEAGCNT